MKNVYLGMALRGAPTWWSGVFQEQVRGALMATRDIELTQFVGLQNIDAAEIYRHDIEMAKSADVMVALTRFPSLGLGMELQARVDLGKPTLVLHPEGETVSGMVLGAPLVQVHYYSSSGEDGDEQAQQIAAVVHDWINQL